MDGSTSHGVPGFPDTSWTMVLASGADRSAAGHLCTLYWLPVYAYLRRDGKSPHDAEDLTQDLFYHLLRRNDMARVRPTGRFRSYLLTALKHHLANHRARSSAAKRGGGHRPLAIDVDVAEEHLAPSDGRPTEPDHAYDRDWARSLVARVVEQLSLESSRNGAPGLFDELRPLLMADPGTVSAEEIGLRLDKSPGAVRVALFRMRKRFAKLLREEVAATVSDPDEVDKEIRYLITLISG